MTETKPKYKHDCKACVFLGEFEGNDLYYHPTINGYIRTEHALNIDVIESTLVETIICRHSSDGSDYTSGLVFAGLMPELTEAWRRCEDLGLKPFYNFMLDRYYKRGAYAE